MSTAFEIVQGDLEPALDIDLQVNSVAEDVSDATGPIHMHWLKPDGTVVVVVVTNVNLALGQVEYRWTTGDTDMLGVHRARVVVPRPDGNQTFPSNGTWIRWLVYEAV